MIFLSATVFAGMICDACCKYTIDFTRRRLVLMTGITAPERFHIEVLPCILSEKYGRELRCGFLHGNDTNGTTVMFMPYIIKIFTLLFWQHSTTGR